MGGGQQACVADTSEALLWQKGLCAVAHGGRVVIGSPAGGGTETSTERLTLHRDAYTVGDK